MNDTHACDACLRRADLLAALATPLGRLIGSGRTIPAALALPEEALIEAAGGLERERIRDRWRGFCAGRARREAAGAGLDAVCTHDERFPASLRNGEDPPQMVYIAGGLARLVELESPTVTIVGARRPTAYGRAVARSIAYEIAATCTPVVSGLALGIDAAAHRGALDAAGFTVAVLAGGADAPTPRSNHGLYREILDRGVAISEMPPGFQPRRWSFPARNRIMAALAQLTVVVEATQRSGSLITADFARQLGRDVGAVPGQITSPLSAGTNALIADGALVVRGGGDVVEELYGLGSTAATGRARDGRRRQLDADSERLLAAVEGGAGTVDALAQVAGSVGDALAGLGTLESLGLLVRGADGIYLPTSS